ncbi:MAG: hypothetical protein KF782_23135 [Labilithrix sp.]|nr:hypothetical protein [Labilithrix sp.]
MRRSLASAASAFLVALPLGAALVACSVDASSAPPADADAGNVDAPCEEGASRCDGDRIATCAGGVFGAAAPCEGESVCRDGACRAPTDAQLAQAAELASVLEYVREETAWHAPIDWDALRVDGRKRVLGGDGSDLAYFTALFHAFVAVPQGHQGLYLARGCGKLVPYPDRSQRGACGRPHARGVVVTSVKANNALGLKVGDLVTRVGDASGGGVLEALAERPMCATSRPSASYRDATTAATFSDLLLPGEEILVESPDGATRAVKVPDAPLPGALGSALSCQDPFSRSTAVPVEATLRPDGVGVIRLPGFLDPQQPFPQNPTEESIAAYRAAFQAKILAAFDEVKAAPAIVWDVRGNGGGLTLIGLEIASGFPGARAETISYCRARVPKSDPPAFDSFRYAEYALTPGGPFAYAGKVAVLVDGLDYSAADYFPLAARTRTDAILVGAPTAGGYGATSKMKLFDGPPAFNVSVDSNRCAAADDDAPLEGRGVIPHVAVGYEPKDLAAGTDTVLERAVAELE